MLTEAVAQPRLVLFASKDEYDTLCRETESTRQDPFTLGAARRLGVPYDNVTPWQRSLMKVTFMHILLTSH